MQLLELDAARLEQRLTQALTVELIATPQPWRLASVDAPESVTLQMAEESFDVLPVDQAPEFFWVHPRAVPQLALNNPEKFGLSAKDLVAGTTPVLEVLELMVLAGRRFYFVLDGAKVSGLVTYSDIDKRPVRTAVFALVNAVEDMLLRKFTATHPNDDEWRGWLGRRDQDLIDHYWEDARSRELDLSRVYYASFAQLTNLIARSPLLGPAMCQQFGDRWTEKMRQLRQSARDPVAHPGKPLIAQAEDVERLAEACRFGRAVLTGLPTLDLH